MVQPNGARLASPSKPCQQWQRKEVQAKLDSIYTQAYPPGNNNNNKKITKTARFLVVSTRLYVRVCPSVIVVVVVVVVTRGIRLGVY